MRRQKQTSSVTLVIVDGSDCGTGAVIVIAFRFVPWFPKQLWQSCNLVTCTCLHSRESVFSEEVSITLSCAVSSLLHCPASKPSLFSLAVCALFPLGRNQEEVVQLATTIHSPFIDHLLEYGRLESDQLKSELTRIRLVSLHSCMCYSHGNSVADCALTELWMVQMILPLYCVQLPIMLFCLGNSRSSSLHHVHSTSLCHVHVQKHLHNFLDVSRWILEERETAQ